VVNFISLHRQLLLTRADGISGTAYALVPGIGMQDPYGPEGEQSVRRLQREGPKIQVQSGCRKAGGMDLRHSGVKRRGWRFPVIGMVCSCDRDKHETAA